MRSQNVMVCQWVGGDSRVSAQVVIDHSISGELCQGSCNHVLDGCQVQLNSCSFYRELYMGQLVDPKADYLYHGVTHGFDIVDPDCSARCFCSNYSSIESPEFKKQMDVIVAQELELDKVSVVSFVPDCVHALGAIRKSNGKLRPITDCRRPLGQSINNAMITTFAPFRYVTLDDISDELVGNEFLAVVDIKPAYRSINISPRHRKYQGFKWTLEGVSNYYTDNCISFGLRCAPYLFTQFTEFLVRAMHRRGFHRIFGYIDDFLLIGADKKECEVILKVFLGLLRSLGFYVSWEKLQTPAQQVRYLGVIIDTAAQELRLRADKMDKLYSHLDYFRGRSHANKQQLMSLSGTLSHCSRLVRGGRTFSRRAINLAKGLKELNSVICLPEWFREDLKWWQSFASCFNGKVSFFDREDLCDEQVYTDSSLSGFGGVYGQDWFLGVWSLRNHLELAQFPRDHVEAASYEWQDGDNINVMELWPVLCALRRWGAFMRNKKIVIRSDNSQVIAMLNTGRSRNDQCMRWLCELFWLSFIFNVHVVGRHVRSIDNTLADYLSRVSDSTVRSKLESMLVTGGYFLLLQLMF